MNVTSALGWILGSSTPSGAIDVVSVRQNDGTFTCSPFHVKLPIPAKSKGHKRVNLIVNGNPVEVTMRLGSAGEAFFILKNDEVADAEEKDHHHDNMKNDGTTKEDGKSFQEEGVGRQMRKSRSTNDLVDSSKRDMDIKLDLSPDPRASSQIHSMSCESPLYDSTESVANYYNGDHPGNRARIHSFAAGEISKQGNYPPLTENNLAKIEKANEKSTSAEKKPGAASWKWAWGDLPIKFSDPSIADLHSLTANTLLRKKKNRLRDKTGATSGVFSAIDSTDVNFASTVNSFSSSLIEGNTSPVLNKSHSSTSTIPVDKSSHEHGKVDRLGMYESDYEEDKNNIQRFDQIDPLEIGNNDPKAPYKKSSGTGVLIQRNSTASALEVAVALSAGAKHRLLSLCAHVLSGEPDAPEKIPETPDLLQKVLQRYAVTEEQFSKSPTEIVTNPNLVVVANDILIPWRLVHSHLMRTIESGQNEETLSVCKSNKSMSEGHMNVDNVFSWAGTAVSNWHSGIMKTKSTKNQTKQSASEDSALSSAVSSDKASNDDDYGQLEELSDRSSNLDNRPVYTREGESSLNHDCSDLMNGIYGSYFRANGDTDTMKLWSKENVDWNSSTDLSKMRFHLFNSFGDGNEETVPDLLRPYVDVSKEKEEYSSQSNVRSSGLEDARIGDDNYQIEMISGSIKDKHLRASRSHDSGLQSLSVPQKQEKILDDKPSNKPLVSSNDDQKKDVDYLSLDDISPDDICPGPARGDINSKDESDTESFYSLNLDETESCASNAYTDNTDNPSGLKKSRKYLYRKSLVPNQDQLKAMNLKNGQNEISFHVEGEMAVKAHIYVWPPDAKVIVADIEGAVFVTNSGKALGRLGIVMSLWGGTGRSQKESHDGLAQLFNNIANNGYHFLYIATTPNASSKEDLLKSQQTSGSDQAGLPLGPVFLPPDTLIEAFGRERTDLYKAAALRGVRTLFTDDHHNPYHAAFGAQERDVRAFDRCGLPKGRIFLVNEEGNITTVTSTTVRRTFADMNALLHEIFPSVCDSFCRENGSTAIAPNSVEDAYSDFNYWRVPPTLLTLS